MGSTVYFFITGYGYFFPVEGKSTVSEITKRLGRCVICGSRVYTDDKYLKAAEGYCHRACIADTSVFV